MKRHFLTLFLAFFCIIFCPLANYAQGEQAYIEDLTFNTVRVKPSQGIFWKISGKDLPQASYIYGVLHLVPRAHFFLHPDLDSILLEVKTVMMEVDPETEKKDYLFRSEVPIDSTLDVILPKRDYKAVLDFINQKLTEDSRLKMIQRYPPLILLRQIMIDYCLYRKIDKEAMSYEAYLRLATKDKRFQSLQMEWIRLAWLDSHSLQEQSQLLLQAFQEKENLKLAYEGMLRAYRQGNLDRVWLLSHNSPDLGDNKHTLMDLKVSNWKNSLSKEMPKNPICAIVPAIALPGEYGLLHVLRKEGYKVEAIKMK